MSNQTIHIMNKSILFLIFLLIPLNSFAKDFTQDSTCIGAWNFDETSGDLLDLCGSNNGTLFGATQGVTGEIGNAYSFDGLDDYVTMGDVTILDGLDTVTWCAWFNTSLDFSAVGSSTSLVRKDGTGTPFQYTNAFTNFSATLWTSGFTNDPICICQRC